MGPSSGDDRLSNKSAKPDEGVLFRAIDTAGSLEADGVQGTGALDSGTSTPETPDPYLYARERAKRKSMVARFTALGIAILATLGTVIALRVGHQSNLGSATVDASQKYPVTSIPLATISSGGGLSLQNNQVLSINGQLTVNNALVLTPSKQPSTAVAGQLYFDQTSNQLTYFNGTNFVNVASKSDLPAVPASVSSLGGATGSVAVSSGLNVTGNTLSNTGVLSLQGQSGNVSLTAGGGIAVNGTTLSNTGVLSLGGQNGDISVGAGLGISGNQLRNTGIISATGIGSITVTNDGNGNITIDGPNGSGGGTVSSPGGTAGKIAKFTGVQTIADSLLSDNGTTVTVSGNLAVTGSVSLTTPLSVTSGGTGANNAGGARTNLGAAASGANSDITSLSGLTTALTVAQGGTGVGTLPTNSVLLGNGTSGITSAVAGASGLCLISTAGAPTFSTCPGSGGVVSVNGLTGTLSIANATAAGSTITLNDASTVSKGIASFNATNFVVSAGAVNTAQNISVSSSPTFASLTLTAPLSVANGGLGLSTLTANQLIYASGTSSIGQLSNGTSGQCLVSNGAGVAPSFQTCTGAGGVSSLNGLTGSITIANASGAAGTITINSGKADGATKGIVGFNSANFTDNGSGIINTIQGIATTSTPTFAGLNLSAALALGNGGTGATTAPGARTNLGAAASGANSDITSLSGLTTALSVSQGGTGLSSLTANQILIAGSSSSVTQLANGTTGQCLVSNGAGVAPSFQTCTGAGGVSSLNSLTGNITIANASAAAGTVTINDASTAAKGIASFNSTNFTVSSGAVNTVQNINTTAAPTFGQLTLTSSQATNPMFVVNNTNLAASGALLDLQLNGTSKFSVTPSGNVSTTGTINGQTISSTANFTGSVAVGTTLSVNTITPSSSLTIGATGQSFILQGNASSTLTATSGVNKTTVGFQTPTANVTYNFPTAAAGTYNICTTAGNCAGVGGGVTTPGGTSGTIAKFTGSGSIADSIITDNGTTVTIGGALSVNTLTPTAALTVGSTGQNLILQGATVNLTTTSAGITNALTFATPSGSNKTITLPDASGTVAVSASGPLALDASGNLTCPTCLTSGGGGGTSGVSSVNSLTGALTLQGSSASSVTSAGTTITINDASSTVKGLASFNSTNLTVVSGAVNTVQDIAVTSTPTFASLNLGSALTIANGGTGATTAPGARTNLGAAASGANNDITSLTGLTTALSVSQGGTGTTSLTANGVLIGNGTGAISAVTGSTGQCLLATAGAPVFGACPGSGGVTSVNGQNGAVTIQGASGSGGTITIQDASTTQKGLAEFNSTNFSDNGSGIISVKTGGITTTEIADGTIANADLSTGTFGNITGTGALTAGSIGSGFGTISTGNNISTTAALQGGTATLTGGNSLTLGTASTNTGSIKLYSSAGTGSVTLSLTNPGSNNFTLSIPTLSGNDTICTLTSGCGSAGISTIGALDGGTANANGATISGSSLYLQSASGSFAGLVNTTTQTFAGNKTFSGSTTLNNTTLAAGTSITITGGNTASRPGSPTAGMLYYDTTTNQLIQYNGTKWVSDHSTATKIVAASNSTQAAKDAADYVATGTDDQNTINSALTAAAGGNVYLMEGTYNIGTTNVSVPDNTTLAGAGAGTILKFQANLGSSTYYFIKNTNVSTGTNVVVRDVLLDGNKANQTSGSGVGIQFSDVGSSTTGGGSILNVVIQNLKGSSGRAINLVTSTNVMVRGVTVLNGDNDGITINNTSTNNTITGNTIASNAGIGIYVLNTSTNNTITGNTLRSNPTGIYLGSDNNTIASNTITSSTSWGMRIDNADGNTISNNTLQTDAIGIYANVATYNTFTGNNIIGSTNYGMQLLGSSNNNTVTGNKIHDSGGATNNYGIYISSSDSNAISTNDITDTSCTTTCYAIYIGDAAADSNRLSANSFTGSSANAATISDVGTGTIYANQQDGNGSVINRTQGGTFTIGTTTAAGSLTIQGGVVAGQLPAPTVVNLIPTGGVATTWRYQVTALDGTGETIGSTVAQTTSGPTTLDASHYNTFNWKVVPGAYQYNIYRCSGASCTPLKLTTVSGITTTYKDTGGTTSGSLPSSNTTGGGTFAGALQGTNGTLTGGSLTLGTVNSAEGAVKFLSSTGTGSVTLDLGNGASAGNYTISLPSITANDTICLQTKGNCSGAGASTVGALDGGTANANGATITSNTLYLQSASASFAGLVNTTTQTFAGNKTFSGTTALNNTTLVAGTSITITGGNQASRPGSPSAGMLYYDTTNNEFIQYNGTKWVSAPRTATKIVAANNSAQFEKDAADYVAPGAGDQATINTALTALSSSGGTVYLMEGTYSLNTALLIPNNVTLAGSGAATIISVPNAQNGSYALVSNSDAATGTHVTVRDLQIDGNKANQTSGSMYGIYFSGMGSTGSRDGGKILNVIVKNVYGNGIYINSGAGNTITGNTVQGNLSDGITLNSVGAPANNAIGNNTVQNNGTVGISIGGPNNTVTGNTIYGSGSNGILLSTSSASGNTVTGNNVQISTSHGIAVSGASYNTISGNTVTGGSANGIRLTSPASYNVISGNKLHDNGGATTNEGIALSSNASNNTIVDNDITDTSCTTNCYALDISASTATANYLANNHYSGSASNSATINDLGTGTVYANQADSSGNLINKSLGGGFTIGASSASATLTLQGGLVANQLAAPTLSATVTNVGTAGTTTYRYQVTALEGTGETTGSTIQQTTTGNATLSGTNYNTITWAAVPGAVQYNIYRCSGASCTPLKLATVSGSVTSYNDQAAGSPSGAAPSTNTTGGASLQGGGLTLGTASTNTGSIKLYSASGSGSVTLSLSSPGSNNYTLSIPTLTGNDTICTVGTGCGTAGANTALSNLTGTSINQSLIANANNSLDLGSAGTAWRSGYFGTQVQTALLDSIGTTLNVATSNATTINIATNAAAHTLNIATDGSTVQTITAGSTKSGSVTTIQGGMGSITENSSGISFGIGGTGVGSIDTAGRFLLQPVVDTTNILGVKTASTGSYVFDVSTTTGLVEAQNFQVMSGGDINVLNGTLTLQGTRTTTYVSPLGTSLNTKINIPNYDPGAFNQVIALGLPSTADSNARAILLTDARTGTHQPTIGITSPNEAQIFGLSWEGSNSSSYLKTTGSNVILQANGTNALTASSSGNVTVSGSLLTGTLDTASAAALNIGTSTATSIVLGDNSGSTPVTIQAGTGNISLLTNSSSASIIGKSVTNSTTAFQIQNASSVGIFTVDTSGTTITLGSVASGNYITFSAAGGFNAFGTAQHTKLIRLNAEYAGAVLDAQGDATCTAATNGTMTSAYDDTNDMSYYNWAGNASAQCYDVVARVTLPSDFNGWSSSTPLSISTYSTNTTNGTLNLYVRDTAHTAVTGCNFVSITPGSASTWATNSSSCNLSTGTYTAGQTITIRIRMTADASSSVRIGDLSLSYSSKF